MQGYIHAAASSHFVIFSHDCCCCTVSLSISCIALLCSMQAMSVISSSAVPVDQQCFCACKVIVLHFHNCKARAEAVGCVQCNHSQSQGCADLHLVPFCRRCKATFASGHKQVIWSVHLPSWWRKGSASLLSAQLACLRCWLAASLHLQAMLQTKL